MTYASPLDSGDRQTLVSRVAPPTFTFDRRRLASRFCGPTNFYELGAAVAQVVAEDGRGTG